MEREYNYVLFATKFDWYRYIFKDAENDEGVKYYGDITDLFTGTERKLYYNIPFGFIKKLILKNALKRIKFETQKPICFIYFTHFIPAVKEGLLDMAKTVFPGSRHVNYYTDAKNISDEALEFSFKTFDAVGIHDKNVAEKYGLQFWPSPYPTSYEEKDIDYDLCFIGRSDDRLERLKALSSFCERNGIRAGFFCYDENQKGIFDGINYFNKLKPYPETVEIINRSKCVLELGIEKKQYAVSSLRVTEAASMKKRILTDNPRVFDNPLCAQNPGNICLYDSVEDIDVDFLKDDSVASWGGDEEYSINVFFGRINKCL